MRSRLGSLGDACAVAAALTPQFSNDDIASAFNALVQTFADEQAQYQQMVAQAHVNAGTLSPDGLQQTIAALQLETSAVNDLQNIVSQAQAIVNCLGITGTNTIPGLNGLGLWPAIAAGAVVAVLTAMGLWYLIQNANAKADQAKANFQAAQNLTSVITAANTCLQAGTCTPDQYNQMLTTGALAQPCPQGYSRDSKGQCQPPGLLSNFPWGTALLIGGGLWVAGKVLS